MSCCASLEDPRGLVCVKQPELFGSCPIQHSHQTAELKLQSNTERVVDSLAWSAVVSVITLESWSKVDVKAHLCVACLEASGLKL